MTTKAMAWTLAGGLLFAGMGRAETLDDVRARMAPLRIDRPMTLMVDVKLQAKGATPLRWNRSKRRGMVTFLAGPDGVRMKEEKSSSFSSGISFSSSPKKRHGSKALPSLLDFDEARVLADPVEVLALLLQDATLLEDRRTTWQGQPARLLRIRPAVVEAWRQRHGGEPKSGKSSPLKGALTLWVDESGLPLALEQSIEFRAGHVLSAAQRQTYTFQQVEGILLVAGVEERSEGSALAVLRGRDRRTMSVSVAQP